MQDALDKLVQGRTTLIIAHRLSTIEKATKIVVLDKGTVLASGTHPDLLHNCRLYRGLYERQFAPPDSVQAQPVPQVAAVAPAA